MDVAKLAGVSQSAVSSILNNNEKVSFSDETRNKVFAAAQQLNYHLPNRKKPKSTKDMGLILVLVPTLSNLYYAELGRALESYADSLGVKAIVCSTFRKSELEKYYLDLFLKIELTGIVYTFLPSFPQMIRQIDAQVPVVMIGGKEDDLSVCSIELSDYKSARLMGEHLYSLGHRHFLFVSTPLKHTTLSRRRRLEGLQQVLTQLGLPKEALQVAAPPESTMYNESDNSFQPYEYTVGKQLTELLLKKGTEATAIIAVNDMTAIGVLEAVKTFGYSVPQDYSVCGFDNIFISSVSSPSLTTIDHQMTMRCKAAIDMIMARGDSGISATITLANKIEYSPQLIIRGSTGPARTGQARQGDTSL